jgi:hypothetical protein
VASSSTVFYAIAKMKVRARDPLDARRYYTGPDSKGPIIHAQLLHDNDSVR